VRRILFLFIFLAGCGQNVCERALTVRHSGLKIICEKAEARGDCKWLCPCLCVDIRQDIYIVVDARGLPDLDHSGCHKPKPCEGYVAERAEACLADEALCAQLVAAYFDEDFNWNGIPLCGDESPLDRTVPIEECPYEN